MSEAKWSVENGIFIGLILCDQKSDIDLQALGVNVEPEEHWLTCCIDLREITLLRARGYEDDSFLTIMESKECGCGSYTVAAPLDELLPHFVKSREPKYETT